MKTQNKLKIGNNESVYDFHQREIKQAKEQTLKEELKFLEGYDYNSYDAGKRIILRISQIKRQLEEI